MFQHERPPAGCRRFAILLDGEVMEYIYATSYPVAARYAERQGGDTVELSPNVPNGVRPPFKDWGYDEAWRALRNG